MWFETAWWHSFIQTEQIQTWKVMNVQDIITQANQWLQGIRLELPTKNLDISQTIEEKHVLDLVKKVWLKESFKDNIYTDGVQLKKIQDKVFSVISNTTGNVNYFVNERWEIILSLFAFSKDNKISSKTAEILAWIKRVDEWEKKNVIYKIIGAKNGEAVYADTPLDITSKEYYQAWMDLNFFDEIQMKTFWLNGTYKETNEWLDVMIHSGALRIDDLEFYLQRWIITPEQFETFLPKMFEKLSSQCGDRRFSRAHNILPKGYGWKLSMLKDPAMSDFFDNYSIAPIKESDLKRYFERYKDKWLTPEIVQKCYNNLPENMRNK